MKLVHWPLMGGRGLKHLVQRGGDNDVTNTTITTHGAAGVTSLTSDGHDISVRP